MQMSVLKTRLPSLGRVRSVAREVYTTLRNTTQGLDLIHEAFSTVTLF